LEQVLRPLTEISSRGLDPDLLVGLDRPDDAAVYRLAEDLALVVTVDFFTPIVDDPYAYGAIAAANSLSDAYAMNARPLLALNVAGLPSDLPVEMTRQIFRGGADKAREAGIPVAGGHTVRDKEPKYGLVVVATLHPDELKRKGGARSGDRLLLSKPLGSGVVTTGLMRDTASPAELAAATESMMRLNAMAARVATAAAATAITDVTGFGLLGHLAEMCESSGVGARIRCAALPWLPGAERLGRALTFPGGAHDNRDHFGPRIRFAESLEEWQQLLCCSPETSGGLLMAVPETAVPSALAEAASGDVELREIGEIVPGRRIELLA
jgi:selenide,water dikinase